MEEHEAAEKLKDVKVGTESPVDHLTEADYKKVVDLCYKCKLCYPKCPYVPPHEFAVDFPRLMAAVENHRDARTRASGFGRSFSGRPTSWAS